MVEAHRLVTLIGPGGVGKTRLLGEIGLRLRAARPDRPVVMCELATASDESAVDVVAAALGDRRPPRCRARRAGGRPCSADTEIVLLLDNCEHVLDPIAELVERLLATCPSVTVVATSRERLRVPGEQLCTVPTLPATPRTLRPCSCSSSGPAPWRPASIPIRGELAVVAEIVRRLDGLPLAIELAAARLHTLDVAEVAAGLDHRFLLLSSGYRTSARHGSLQRGGLVVVRAARRDRCDGPSPTCRSSPGPFTAADAAAVCGVDAATATVGPGPAGRALARDAGAPTGATCCWRRSGRSAPSSSPPTDGPTSRASATLVTTSSGSRPPTPAGGAGRPRRRHRDRCRAPGAAHRARLAARPRRGRARRPSGQLAPRLRPPATAARRLAWAERVTDADPDDRSPSAPVVWAVSAYAAWMAGDVDGGRRRAPPGPSTLSERGRPRARRRRCCMLAGNYELFEGRLDEAATWYRRARARGRSTIPPSALLAARTELLAARLRR